MSERDESVARGMVAQTGPPPYIEWDPRPDGTARATLRMDIGRGQNLLIDGCYFTPESTELATVAVSHGPHFHRRRWWERLLRRPPRVIKAHMTVTSNYFEERRDG